MHLVYQFMLLNFRFARGVSSLSKAVRIHIITQPTTTRRAITTSTGRPSNNMDTPHQEKDVKPLEIADMRKPYKNEKEPYFLEANASEDPIKQFDIWFKDVASQADRTYEEINAVSVSTCIDNKPSSRMVLLKRYDRFGFVFFTNSSSRKGNEIAQNANGAMLFYWPFVNRQVRVEGCIERLPEKEVDDYWRSRPIGSRIGGAISDQSAEIPSRKYLEEKREALEKRVKEVGADEAVPRPPSWSGFILKPSRFEFWQGQSDRIHDRLAYKQAEENKWTRVRLAP